MCCQLRAPTRVVFPIQVSSNSPSAFLRGWALLPSPSSMAPMMFSAFFLTMLSVSDGAWCVCRQDASSSALQKTIDYACGAGADCNPILQNGACYNPNTVLAHCSYAANSYYQRKGQQAQGACDFAGTAIISQTDPSSNGCSYPATQSSAGSNSTGIGTSAQNPGSASSSTGFTPTQTGAGGVLGGLGPSGTATSIDGSGAGFLPNPKICSLFLIILLSGLLFQRL